MTPNTFDALVFEVVTTFFLLTCLPRRVVNSASCSPYIAVNDGPIVSVSPDEVKGISHSRPAASAIRGVRGRTVGRFYCFPEVDTVLLGTDLALLWARWFRKFFC